MELILKRTTFTPKSTIGELYFNGNLVPECFTLEDTDRRLESTGIKIDGETAIPRGRYKIIIDRSKRQSEKASKKVGHKVDVFAPHILDVPKFEGVRIDVANTAKEILGCIAVGETRGIDFIGRSRAAYDKLFGKIKRLEDVGEEVWITIS